MDTIQIIENYKSDKARELEVAQGHSKTAEANLTAAERALADATILLDMARKAAAVQTDVDSIAQRVGASPEPDELFAEPGTREAAQLEEWATATASANRPSVSLHFKSDVSTEPEPEAEPEAPGGAEPWPPSKWRNARTADVVDILKIYSPRPRRITAKQIVDRFESLKRCRHIRTRPSFDARDRVGIILSRLSQSPKWSRHVVRVSKGCYQWVEE